MNLLDLISGNKNEFLWSLIIEPGWVQAGIWTIAEDEAKVVAMSHPVAWETNEELETATDTALSSAVQTLPESATDPNKVVFGVPASWVQDGQIKKERLEGLRALCKKLTLTPSGFVTLPEAVSFYIKSKEGSPLSAVVVCPGKEMVEVSVFRLGNMAGTTQVARSVSLFDDVVEAISRFNFSDPIPSRFILFDGKDGELAEAKQTLLESSWENLTKIKILHTPKIEILTGEKKIEAVSLGGAVEIAKVSKVESMLTEPSETIEKKDTEVEEPTVKADNFGFVVDKDIAKEPEVKEPTIESSVEAAREEISDTPGPTAKVRKLPAVGPMVGGLFSKVNNILSGGRKPMIMGIVAFILVAVGLFAFWWFYPKATVTIYVAPQKLEETVELTVDTKKTSPDSQNKILPGKVEKTSESGDKTNSTTGNKLVGEKAGGEVEIRNGRSDPLTLKAGTSLVSSNSLEFTIEKESEIPAASSPASPGSAKVSVKGADIGSEYNIAKDELFKVGNYPKAEVDAISTGDFSGGSSRQIQSVSQEDRDKVLDELTDELSDKAKESLKSNIAEDQFFIEGSTTASPTSQTYSGKVGDESDSLKLNLTVEVSGVTVSKKDMFDMASSLLKEKVPQGYILRESQLEYRFELKESKDGVYKLKGNVAANLLPEVDVDNIAREIAGKYTSLAEGHLKNIPGFVKAQIVVHPHFPGKLGSLPHVVKNISIEVASEK